ncbi:rhomboid family intramembrane serine protease [Aeromicrobium fastidiosum]|uniref:Rhomboid family intramembrane serine protease n=1 Tax=Aeromicrobium fastidiosum TaxID=52699 RepID=A0A641AQZ7_9ACTN|nr:rhomboid family intramembrane serine protease [Aeromicrobium fastidiosum]KAA1380375.1 rhomboid family intramembrane serine protease [Aeromicrobium fastidiosum]
MREASVGFQCPSCIAEGAKTIRQPRTVAGGAITGREGRVSMILIAINVAAYVAQVATGGFSSEIYQRGAMQGYLVADGDYWRLLTSAFLHNGLLHLAFNMYALYLFGPFVERALGTARYVVAYLTAAVGGSISVYLITDPLVGTAGASGAIYGLLAMALVFLLKAKQDVRALLVLLAINAFISVAGARISWEGHLGGFVAGLALGAVFAYAPRDRRTLVQVLAISAIWIAMIVAFVLRTSALTP